MPINSTGLSAAALTLQQNFAFAQLHSGAAGEDYGSNLAVLARQQVSWSQPTTGSFGMRSALRFVGGTPGGTVHSITLWDAISDGNCGGEFLLTGGDSAFNPQGEFLLTAIDFTVTATDTA